MHPIQPVALGAGGVLRFKANPIVQHLLDTHPKCDLNELARRGFDAEDHQQLAQLIGYSVSGYLDLHYVTPEAHAAAVLAAAAIGKAAKRDKKQGCTLRDVQVAVWMHDGYPLDLPRPISNQVVGVTLKVLGLNALGRAVAVDLGNGYVLHCTTVGPVPATAVGG